MEGASQRCFQGSQDGINPSKSGSFLCGTAISYHQKVMVKTSFLYAPETGHDVVIFIPQLSKSSLTQVYQSIDHVKRRRVKGKSNSPLQQHPCSIQNTQIHCQRDAAMHENTHPYAFTP